MNALLGSENAGWLILGFGSVQGAVVIILSFVALMQKGKILDSEARMMKRVRAEFVPAQVSIQQFASLNLLLTNLGGGVENIRDDLRSVQTTVNNVDQRLARVEGRLSSGVD